jgi:hypothetical protein
VRSWVPIPILIPVNRGANPGFFPRSRPNRDSPISRDPGQIGIGAKSRVSSPGRSRPNRDRENPGHFPGQIGAGRGGIRGFGGLAGARSFGSQLHLLSSHQVAAFQHRSCDCGPAHCTRVRRAVTLHQEYTGATRPHLRDRLLSAMGWHVVSIPFFEWDRLYPTEQRDAYVERPVHRSV